MSKQPVVLIVGKPNVGKSTLFNRLIRKRKSIVDDIPGVTRDSVVGEVRFENRTFRLVDTCGLFGNPQDEIEEKMWDITLRNFDDADLILFVIDALSIPTMEDFKIAETLRKTGKKILLISNKSENRKRAEENISYFYELGMGDPFSVSAAHGHGINTLLDIIDEHLNYEEESVEDTELEEEIIRVAIVGKPNAGKSLLFNTFLGQDRAMVTPIAGTTRDSIDELVEFKGNKYSLIDTAGLRRRSRVKNYSLESFSMLRTHDAIDNCDVAVLLIDITEGISDQDKKIAGIIEEMGKASIVVFNKVDLLNEKEKEKKYRELRKAVEKELYFIRYSEILFSSAKEKTGLKKIYDSINRSFKSYSYSFSTSAINDALERMKIIVQPPSVSGRRLKLYYATQTGIKPPIITIFVNDAKIIPDSYKKALKNQFRKFLDPLKGSPLFLKFVPRREK